VGLAWHVVQDGYFFKKNALYLKSNLKAAAYAAQGRFCCTHRAAIRQRQQDKSQEKARSKSTAKAKTNTDFPRGAA
jgi:hypothetical protein